MELVTTGKETERIFALNARRIDSNMKLIMTSQFGLPSIDEVIEMSLKTWTSIRLQKTSCARLYSLDNNCKDEFIVEEKVYTL